jgi:UMF1 family MFS transporter
MWIGGSVAVEAKTLKRARWAWYWYDFGNSAYAAVVLLAVYSVYFKGTVVGGAEGSRLWGLSIGIAMLVAAVISPVLGTIADYSAARKRFLFIFTAMSCLFTGLLFLVQKGDVFLGVLFFVLAEIGYRAAQVFYNALLTEISGPEDVATVSGFGWAFGSAGGIVCLLIVLPLILLFPGPLMVRLSLLITGIFFAIFSVPIFIWLREQGERRPLPPGENYVSLAFGRLWSTLKRLRHFREFAKYVVSLLVYENGVIMALDFAAIIGAVLFGMNQQMLIVFVIVVQVTNVVGAYAFGLLAEKWGCKRSLIVSLVMMIATVIWMVVAPNLTQFFVIGGLAGFAMAGIQSVSRTFVSVISPRAQAAEFFGFFAMTGRTSAFMGPAVYGVLAHDAAMYFERRGMAVFQAEQLGQRVGIASIALFLAVGLVLLLLVNEKRAIQAAEEANGA